MTEGYQHCYEDVKLNRSYHCVLSRSSLTTAPEKTLIKYLLGKKQVSYLPKQLTNSVFFPFFLNVHDLLQPTIVWIHNKKTFLLTFHISVTLTVCQVKQTWRESVNLNESCHHVIQQIPKTKVEKIKCCWFFFKAWKHISFVAYLHT